MTSYWNGGTIAGAEIGFEGAAYVLWHEDRRVAENDNRGQRRRQVRM